MRELTGTQEALTSKALWWPWSGVRYWHSCASRLKPQMSGYCTTTAQRPLRHPKKHQRWQKQHQRSARTR